MFDIVWYTIDSQKGFTNRISAKKYKVLANTFLWIKNL